MFPTIVKNNFFNNVNEIINYLKLYKYNKPSKKEGWFGLGQNQFIKIIISYSTEVVVAVLKLYCFNNFNFKNSKVCFFKIECRDKHKFHYHKDYDNILAAVIYLSKGTTDGGTTIFGEE